MGIIRLLIVEDDLTTSMFIEKVVEDKCQDVNVVGVVATVDQALYIIKNENPDIVLMDVEIKDGTAFDILKQVKNESFYSIFITAHRSYAYQAIKFSAFDYLLKPFKPEQLVEAIDKAVKRVKEEKVKNGKFSIKSLLNNLSLINKQSKTITLRTGSDIHLIVINEIIYCSADTSYTHFILEDRDEVVVSNSLKEYENFLSEYGFIRTHHGYLVNVIHIKRFHKTGQPFLEMSNGHQVPVSVRNKERIASIFK
jgi:two-component system LytT family response regulator